MARLLDKNVASSCGKVTFARAGDRADRKYSVRLDGQDVMEIWPTTVHSQIYFIATLTNFKESNLGMYHYLNELKALLSERPGSGRYPFGLPKSTYRDILHFFYHHQYSQDPDTYYGLTPVLRFKK